jgi:hypothetical protein
MERLRAAVFRVKIDPFWQKFTISEHIRFGLVHENMILEWKL